MEEVQRVTLAGCPEISSRFDPLAENFLAEKCKNIMQIINLVSGRDADAGSLVDAVQAVDALCERLVQARAALHGARLHSGARFWELYGVVGHTLELCAAALREHQHGAAQQRARVGGLWLTKRCEALGLKLNVMHTQLLRDTYTHDAVAALRLLHAALVDARTQAQQALADTQRRLAAYEAVDGLRQLAQSYATITQQIESKRWALEQLGMQ